MAAGIPAAVAVPGRVASPSRPFAIIGPGYGEGMTDNDSRVWRDEERLRWRSWSGRCPAPPSTGRPTT